VIADLIECVRSRGADILPLGERRVYHPERLDRAMIERLRRDKASVLRALAAERLTVTIATQRLLRVGRFPPEPAPCAYHCGRPGERCRRCAASWNEHYA
jgi:hypothetical protein